MGKFTKALSILRKSKQQEDLPPIGIEKGNDAMDQAVERAQATVDWFIGALRDPQPGDASFSVKYPFNDGGENEHIWCMEVTYDGESFSAVVNNEPVYVKSVQFGERVHFPKGKISDWMFIRDGKVQGGFTLRAMREMMKPKERAQFDRSFPMEFAD